MRATTSAVAVLLVLATGCAGKQTLLPDPAPVRFVYPSTVRVATPGLKITASDGSWTLQDGPRATPPFKSKPGPFFVDRVHKPDGAKVLRDYDASDNPAPTGTNTYWPSRDAAQQACLKEFHQRVFYTYLPQSPSGTVITKGELAGRLSDYRALGAQPVTVHYPKLVKPLNGVLYLGPAAQGTKDRAARRTYELKLTRAQVEAAFDGKVSVVQRPLYPVAVRVKGTRFVKPGPTNSRVDEEEFYKAVKVRGATWILWLSDAPFPGD